ncbi:hypothetical protein P3X46_033940 [Hevea brasiliensis]|uniref:Anthocyanidin 3-O-glucosyltransferase n=1 Tax=Hevea brasiliensis TaxID=3981 RepID=A0ABQ9K9L5_HEVBR|nr:hypothetical protein P3X46_033940 [Hevea brasiliensis]
MFPWFAVGHMTLFPHLSNRLAERDCFITFLLPAKAIRQLQHFNLHPHLITFQPLTVPHVDGLPTGTQTASDIPIQLNHLLATALDRTRDQVETVIYDIRPKLVNVAHWVPEITKLLGIEAINYSVVSAASIAIVLVPARNVPKDRAITEAELLPFGEGITFYERIPKAMKTSDALAIRTCHETEGQLCDYIGSQYGKSVFLTRHVLPEPSKRPLEDRWCKWLSGFQRGSVVFCAFGSQIILEKNQFQELVLGFELTGLPFLVALKPPKGWFEERVKGRGVVRGAWVQQLMILDHPSVGCFVNHCGFGSMWESLMSDCQLVLVPHLGDQILNARFMAQDGWFSKESLSKAIHSVMNKGSAVGSILKENHRKWREMLENKGSMSSYVDKFVQNMQQLVK